MFYHNLSLWCCCVVLVVAGNGSQWTYSAEPAREAESGSVQVSEKSNDTGDLLFRKYEEVALKDPIGTNNRIVPPTEGEGISNSLSNAVRDAVEKEMKQTSESTPLPKDGGKSYTSPVGETEDEQEESEAIFRSKSADVPDAKVELPKAGSSHQKEESRLLKSNGADTTASDKGATATSAAASSVTKVPEELPFIGFPNAQEAVQEMYTDLINGMNTRRVSPLYSQWKRYCSSVLRRTNALSTGIELNNRSRLPWYDKMYREPLSSVMEAEDYSRRTYRQYNGSAAGILAGIRDTRIKMNVVPSTEEIQVFQPTNPADALSLLRQSLEAAIQFQKMAIAPLSTQEVMTLSREAYTIFTAQCRNGHTLPNTSRAKYLIDLMTKMNKGAMYDAAEVLVPLTEPALLEQLSKIDLSALEQITMGDQTVYRIETAAGDILIGDRGNNVWDLNKLPNAICIIDLGGSDVYNEGVCNVSRPVLVVLDLGKEDDRYIGTQPGIQGSSILGAALWYNAGGNNTYQARDLAQGSTIGGVGILIDEAGDDTYLSFLRGQGTALCGLGVHIDRAGNDDYRSAMLAQGLGQPDGFGLLLDRDGKDHYYVGGYYLDSYEEHPGYDGWGQGIGTGIRGVACGGIGMILDGGGDDEYEFDYFAHGGGYWMGVGIARDFGGNDRRLGATLSAYNGGARSQARWQRFSNGFGCHYAVGYLFDDQGNDSYNGTIMGLGMAWDLSAGFLVDFDGDDVFEATGGLTQGTGAEGSIGVIMEYRGSNTYKGAGQGYAGAKLTYHQQQDCGANFSFVVDHGGQDQYGCRAANNTMSQRGLATGFIIDRPTPEELVELEEERQRANEEKAAQELARKETKQKPAPEYQPTNYQQNSGNNYQQRYNNGRPAIRNGWWRN